MYGGVQDDDVEGVLSERWQPGIAADVWPRLRVNVEARAPRRHPAEQVADALALREVLQVFRDVRRKRPAVRLLGALVRAPDDADVDTA